MGEMMRRFWVPACLSEELPEPDGDPMRVRLLGEDLVAFRDSSGRIGLMEERCPHRQASLFFGRNEEGGLRCLYHGWKIDVEGNVLDTPCEQTTLRVRHRAYPAIERADLIWVYMGPPSVQPPPPDFWWMQVPPENRGIGKIDYDCNYLQAMEGGVDTHHSDVLHSGWELLGWPRDRVREIRAGQGVFLKKDAQCEVQDTAYGFRYASQWVDPTHPERKYVRVHTFAVPFHCLLSQAPHMFIPIDDERTWYYDVKPNIKRPEDREVALRNRGERMGADVGPDYRKLRTLQNGYLQDRKAMREKKELWSYSGIPWGKPHEDMVVMETMGAILDRTKEHLAPSDLVVITMRRRMLEAVREFMRTGQVWGEDVPWDRIAGDARVVPVGTPWQAVGAFAGEPVPESVGSA
jgi:phthalate 4,5-dioxygenase oxygenase subunit